MKKCVRCDRVITNENKSYCKTCLHRLRQVKYASGVVRRFLFNLPSEEEIKEEEKDTIIAS